MPHFLEAEMMMGTGDTRSTCMSAAKGEAAQVSARPQRIKIMHTLEACYGALSLMQGEATQFYVNGDAIKFVIFFFFKTNR